MATRKKKKAKTETRALPLWQSAVVTSGCQVRADGDLVPLDLHPAGNRIVCTPTVSGWMVPFHLKVKTGQTVTITWDAELSRYIVKTGKKKVAA